MSLERPSPFDDPRFVTEVEEHTQSDHVMVDRNWLQNLIRERDKYARILKGGS